MLVRHRTYTPSLNVDRAFEQLTHSFFDNRRHTAPVVDGAWSNDEFVLTVDLPGVPADAVTVEVTGTTLSLAAATDSFEWSRSVRLGGRLDPDKVHARHVDGRLTVRIGAVDEPEARRVEIDTAAPDTSDLAIEASTIDDSDQSTETNDTE